MLEFNSEELDELLKEWDIKILQRKRFIKAIQAVPEWTRVHRSGGRNVDAESGRDMGSDDNDDNDDDKYDSLVVTSGLTPGLTPGVKSRVS